jgi:hypothetical protein
VILGASRLERALRVFAWVALVATVLALVSAALLVQVSAARGGDETGLAAKPAAATEENR